MKNEKTPDGYTVDAKGIWLKDIPQEVKKVQKETEKVRTTVENSSKNNSVEKEPRRENVTHETTTSSVLEKQSNGENHSLSNPNRAVEEVTTTASRSQGTIADSSSVEKEVGSNTDSATTTTTTVGGER